MAPLFPPHSSDPAPSHPVSPLQEQEAEEPKEGGIRRTGCQVRVHDPLQPSCSWEPLWLNPPWQLQKHPHLPAAVVLLGGPLGQLASLLADGWQGLVTGTVVPATFLGRHGEGESRAPPLHLPTPLLM